MSSIKENIENINAKIEAACQRSGRKREEVLFLVVSKTIDVPRIKEAVACGMTSLGENKVQEIMDKYEPMGEGIKWHLIGHLQTNKVKYVVGRATLIHSVDSLHLAEAIEKESEKKNLVSDILIEVNVACEESKFGLKTDEVEKLVRDVAKLPHLRVKGLMTIAPFVENAEENRNIFRELKALSVDIAAKNIDNISMDILSMGMTGDYEVAVEEGATLVRVGTGIFGERNYSI